LKTKFLILLYVFSLQFAISQNYQTIEEVNDACSQLGFSSNQEAEIAVDAILEKIGLFRNFTIQECPEINNAVAKNIDIGPGLKDRYILYDSEFFKRIDVNAGNDWAATSVLAHEIAHHLNGHALNNEGSNHRFELEADYSSGFYLAKMGATLEDAQSAIQTLKYEKATRTHPAKIDRLLAIEKGFNKGLEKTVVVNKIEDEISKDITENKKDEIINNESEDDYESAVLDYPRTMTPNGDGNNDIWNITGLASVDSKAEIMIFSRFGELMKQFSPIEGGWDGFYKGKLSPEGSYFFLARYKEKGIQNEIKGKFNLIR
jgi:gliding motility-associated-like protein